MNKNIKKSKKIKEIGKSSKKKSIISVIPCVIVSILKDFYFKILTPLLIMSIKAISSLLILALIIFICSVVSLYFFALCYGVDTFSLIDTFMHKIKEIYNGPGYNDDIGIFFKFMGNSVGIFTIVFLSIGFVLLGAILIGSGFAVIIILYVLTQNLYILTQNFINHIINYLKEKFDQCR